MGTAKPGMRDTYKYKILNPSNKYLKNVTKKRLLFILLQFFPEFKESFDRTPDYLAEYVYGLVANKWFLKICKIDLSVQKLRHIISDLMQSQQYQEYLNIEKFETYITIPQVYALSKSNLYIKTLENKFKKVMPKYFYRYWSFTEYIVTQIKSLFKKTFNCVGIGLDAISGCVNINRPYFGAWTNYRLKNSKIYEEINDVTMKTTRQKQYNFYLNIDISLGLKIYFNILKYIYIPSFKFL